jgi:hypothetical protein
MLPRPLALPRLSTILAAFGLLAAQTAADINREDNFRIEGVGLWQCQRPSHGCPCQANGQPKYGTCFAADFAHINKGQYGKTRLDGLNVVLVGNLVDTLWHAVRGPSRDSEAARRTRKSVRISELSKCGRARSSAHPL